MVEVASSRKFVILGSLSVFLFGNFQAFRYIRNSSPAVYREKVFPLLMRIACPFLLFFTVRPPFRLTIARALTTVTASSSKPPLLTSFLLTPMTQLKRASKQLHPTG